MVPCQIRLLLHALRELMLRLMTSAKPALRLYRHALSGHCHRVQLLLGLLELSYEAIEVDLVARAHKRPEFLAKSPFGQIPVLEDGALTLSDSNAILIYLALRYDPARRFLPEDAVAQARVQQWLSVAAGQLAFGPAAARLVKVFGLPLDHQRATTIAQDLLRVLDSELGARRFLAGETLTLADVAMYAYVALAPEGGVTLEPYAHVRAWLARVEATPHFVPMTRTPQAA